MRLRGLVAYCRTLLCAWPKRRKRAGTAVGSQSCRSFRLGVSQAATPGCVSAGCDQRQSRISSIKARQTSQNFGSGVKASQRGRGKTCSAPEPESVIGVSSAVISSECSDKSRHQHSTYPNPPLKTTARQWRRLGFINGSCLFWIQSRLPIWFHTHACQVPQCHFSRTDRH